MKEKVKDIGSTADMAMDERKEQGKPLTVGTRYQFIDVPIYQPKDAVDTGINFGEDYLFKVTDSSRKSHPYQEKRVVAYEVGSDAGF